VKPVVNIAAFASESVATKLLALGHGKGPSLGHGLIVSRHPVEHVPSHHVHFLVINLNA
jgi:hypothetical protein